MDCPKCSLVNPQGALRCDCGHDFSKEYVSQKISWKTRFLRAGKVLLFGMIVAVGIVVTANLSVRFFPTFQDSKFLGVFFAGGMGGVVLATILGFFRELFGKNSHGKD
jgi:hypothetical protein